MTRFVPVHPPRGSGPVAPWRGLFGKRSRIAVYGWSEQAFATDHLRRKVLRFTVHIPLSPEGVEHVLLTNAANYVKPDVTKRLISPVIGEGLVTSDGALWREQRRIVAASFVPPAIEELRPLFERAAARTMGSWDGGSVRDLAADATRTTMMIIAEALFSGDARLTAGEAVAQISAALGGLAEPRMQVVLGLPMVPLSSRARAGRRGQRYLRSTLEQLVDERIEARLANDDFLGRLIAALQQRFPPEEARRLAVDNAATFYLAGHETTANALAWTLYLLSEQPELQEELSEEAQAALGGSEWSTTPVIQSLPRLHAVLQEVFRLYPPAPRFDREAVGEDRLYGETVEAGHIVSIWPWLLHRNRRLWDDPDAFDPDRFGADRPNPDRYQYLPFGAGPRVCVGAQFATVEALTLLALWLAEWRFAPSGRPVEVDGMVTLRPKDGLLLHLSKRRN